jgi:hypothetical protein
MFRPGIEPGPPAWEASTLEKSHLDSLFAGYSESLLGLRPGQQPGLYMASPNACEDMDSTGCRPNSPFITSRMALWALLQVRVFLNWGHHYRGPDQGHLIQRSQD